VWSELGLLGLFAFLIFLAFLFYRFSNGTQSNTQLIGFAALATMCIHGLVDVPFFKNDLAFLTATVLAIALYAKEESTRIEG
jgi:O-antigen ligase